MSVTNTATNVSCAVCHKEKVFASVQFTVTPVAESPFAAPHTRIEVTSVQPQPTAGECSGTFSRTHRPYMLDIVAQR